MRGVIKSFVLALTLIIGGQLNSAPSAQTGQKENAPSESTQEPAKGQQTGTDKAPLVVKLLPTAKTQEETDAEAREHAEKSSNERKLVQLNDYLVKGTLALAAIGFLQLIVFGYQSFKLKQTVEAAEGQSKDMKTTINEITRFAGAMEHVAGSMLTSANAAKESVEILKSRTAHQMRAYLCVTIGVAIFQDRQKGLRFEAKPNLTNTGHTPATDVWYVAKADILPLPLKEDFPFALSGGAKGAAVVGPQQNASMSAIVDNFYPEEDIPTIKSGVGVGLVVWGIVNYKDVFGATHTTKFAQNLVWLADDSIFGYYIPGHNDAT